MKFYLISHFSARYLCVTCVCISPGRALLFHSSQQSASCLSLGLGRDSGLASRDWGMNSSSCTSSFPLTCQFLDLLVALRTKSGCFLVSPTASLGFSFLKFYCLFICFWASKILWRHPLSLLLSLWVCLKNSLP